MTDGVAARRVDALSFGILLLIVIVPVAMGLMDITITNVAFGTVAAAIGASPDEIVAISTSYSLAMLVAMPICGWLAANVTRKRAYLGAIALFTLASLGCALAPSLEALVAARFVQGFGAGIMQTLAFAALIDAFADERQRARAIQVYAIGIMVGPLLGPALGGWILANLAWQVVFLINLPFGALALVLGLVYLPQQTERGARSSFDWTSLVLLFAGLGSLLYVLGDGARLEWFDSQAIVAATIGGVVCFGAFIVRQLTLTAPLVELRTMRIPTFSVALLLMIVGGVGLTGNAFIMPLYYQNVLGFDVGLTGLGMLPTAIGTVVGIQIAGTAFAKRIPAEAFVIGALVLAAAGIFWFIELGRDANFAQTIAPRALQGIASGFMFLPLTQLMLRNIPAAELDAALGLGSFWRQIGISVGYAGIGSLLVRAQTGAIAEYRNHVATMRPSFLLGLAPIRTRLIEHGWAPADASAYAPIAFDTIVVRNATVVAYSQTLFWLAAFFLVSILGVVVLWQRSAVKAGA